MTDEIPPETENVTPFPGVTRLDLNPDTVLSSAYGQLESVVVLGYDEEGEEYFASSIADGATVLWLMERLKLRLLEIMDD